MGTRGVERGGALPVPACKRLQHGRCTPPLTLILPILGVLAVSWVSTCFVTLADF